MGGLVNWAGHVLIGEVYIGGQRRKGENFERVNVCTPCE